MKILVDMASKKAINIGLYIQTLDIKHTKLQARNQYAVVYA